MYLEEFTETHCLILEVHLRAGKKGPMRYYATMKGKFKDDRGTTFTGDGKTGDEALDALAVNVSGEEICVHSWKNGPLELNVPVLQLIKPKVTRRA